MGDMQFNIDFNEVSEGMRQAGGEELAEKLEAIWVAGKITLSNINITKDDGLYKINMNNKQFDNDKYKIFTLGIRYTRGVKDVAELSFKYREMYMGKIVDSWRIGQSGKNKVGAILDRALEELALM